MSGRPFDVQNQHRPRWFMQLVEEKPQCFSIVAWTEYLHEAHRELKDQPDARRAMSRGQLPNYCEDCAGGAWRKSMEEQGKCLPLPPTEQLDLGIEEPVTTTTR